MWSFEVADGSPLLSDGHYRYKSALDTGYPALPIPSLPEGALIVGLQVDVCDMSPTYAIHMLPQVMRGGQSSLMSMGEATGLAATPGCVVLSHVLPVPWRVRNATESYILAIPLDGTPATKLGAARVFYLRQTSPPPATATFGDVPFGHPFHRSVEALAASGIAGGCGSGNFCPDQAVSRGELAVFLVSALGLHFPN